MIAIEAPLVDAPEHDQMLSPIEFTQSQFNEIEAFLAERISMYLVFDLGFSVVQLRR